MAAFPRVRTEAPALRALRTAVQFGKLLTVLRSFAPATSGTTFMARLAHPFGGCEVVNENIVVVRSRDDLFPVDRSYVTEIVVVEKADTSGENICKIKQDDS